MLTIFSLQDKLKIYFAQYKQNLGDCITFCARGETYVVEGTIKCVDDDQIDAGKMFVYLFLVTSIKFFFSGTILGPIFQYR